MTIDLGQQSHEAGEGLDGRGAPGGGELRLLRVDLIVMQEARHSRQHSHGADGLDVAQESFETMLALDRRGAGAGNRACGSPSR